METLRQDAALIMKVKANGYEPGSSGTAVDEAPSAADEVTPRQNSNVRSTVDRVRQLRSIHLPTIAAIAGAALLMQNGRFTANGGAFHIHHVIYGLCLPYVVLSIWGLLTPAPRLPSRVIRSLDRLIICVVTKGMNRDALLRTYQRLLPLCRDGAELCVVTDQPLPIPHLLVPANFRTRRARYKARALEYFRQQQTFGPDDWVLHLDEESVIDESGLEACREFCRRSPFLYGQGPILYNNHQFWRHHVLTAADCVRTGDDLAKFHLQLSRFNRPIFGLHGSFLLVKGSLANEITWDLPASLVEDYAFAVECLRRGLGVGEVAGIVREQSPQTIGDFLRQRRRWLVGIRQLSALSPWARLWSLLWAAGPLVRTGAALDVIFGHGFPVPLLVAGNIFTATFVYLYLLGSLVQDVDRGTPAVRTIWHACLTVALLPVSYALEAVAVIWSFVSRERRMGFQTIRK